MTEELPHQLADMSRSRYFTWLALVFFAFITVFFVYLLTSTTNPTALKVKSTLLGQSNEKSAAQTLGATDFLSGIVPNRYQGNAKSSSGTIFVYNSNLGPIAISVNPQRAVLYHTPAFDGDKPNTWVINSGDTRYLQYEFSGSKFSPSPSSVAGEFVIEPHNLSSFAFFIANKLGLNREEQEALSRELIRRAAIIDSNNLLVKLLKSSVAENLVPMESDNSDLTKNRLFFVVTDAGNFRPKTIPQLDQVNRQLPAVVEIGVVVP